MQTRIKIEQYREQRWASTLAEAEIRQLQRERKHLASKQRERMLTQWEQSRMGQLILEMNNFLQSVNKEELKN